MRWEHYHWEPTGSKLGTAHSTYKGMDPFHQSLMQIFSKVIEESPLRFVPIKIQP